MAKIIDSAAYDELVASGKPFVIDFWAEWCGPCRSLTPIIEELAEEYEGKVVIGKCDVDQNNDLAMKFSVRNIPLVVFVKPGGQMHCCKNVPNLKQGGTTYLLSLPVFYTLPFQTSTTVRSAPASQPSAKYTARHRQSVFAANSLALTGRRYPMLPHSSSPKTYPTTVTGRGRPVVWSEYNAWSAYAVRW